MRRKVQYHWNKGNKDPLGSVKEAWMVRVEGMGPEKTNLKEN